MAEPLVEAGQGWCRCQREGEETTPRLISRCHHQHSRPPPLALIKVDIIVINNAITDGGVAPPTILLTIVMMSSNLKSLRISRNSKYSSRIVGSAQSAFAPAALRSSFAPAALRSAYAPAALRLILIIDL